MADETQAAATPEKPITIAILAIGGQGGGVLTDWIVDVAEREGWRAQSTSVPGVAQRTGATIYYVEMLPAQGDRTPVFSLMPTAGDVDVVVAAEFAEAGRAMLRGIVTPDRTTFIASTHRVYAIAEKAAPGDGVTDAAVIADAVGVTAKRSILFDMQRLAERNGSIISAALLGALAGSGVLPFSRSSFESAISAEGRGTDASIRTFAEAFEHVQNPPSHAANPTPSKSNEIPTSADHRLLDALLRRLNDEIPAPLKAIAYAGLRRVVDYQDVAYGEEYLSRLAWFVRLDQELFNKGMVLSAAAAKYLAVAMCYDDVFRVADLKTRMTRFSRIEVEMGKKPDQLLYITEFFHPRGEEVIGCLPRYIGHWIENRPSVLGLVDRIVNRGRRVRTGTLTWFIVLYGLAGLKSFRRSYLRHDREMESINRWLKLVENIAPHDYALAVEVLNCRRLVKGYSDTHARGMSKFDRVIDVAEGIVGKPDAAAWLRRLTMAALSDEDGTALSGALRTLESAYDITSSTVMAT